MKYRRLGRSGCQVSTISLGSWLTYGCALDQKTTNQCVRTALDVGINLFDTADVYGMGMAERSLAEALDGVPREQTVIATKAYFPMSEAVNDRGLSRKHLLEACDASLSRLRTDYIDLYQCHCPDPDVPMDEIVRAMDDLVRQGKVLYWGVSNWNAALVTETHGIVREHGAHRPVSNQVRYNLLDRSIETDILPTSSRYGLGLIVYSPLAQGVLSGKYSGGEVPGGTRAADDARNPELLPLLTESGLAKADRIAELARAAGVTPAQLALAGILAQPGITSAIVGASRPSQIEENARAADLELPAELLARLDALTRA